MHSSFEPTSIDYDARIFSFREWDWTFSLTLLHSRQRIASALGDRQRAALNGRKPTSATLVKRPDGGYYLHIQISDDAPEPIVATEFIGVDLGVAEIAVDSDGNAYSGKPVEAVRRKHNLQRKRLQRRNTKGARKKLKRIAGKEARFRRHENHVISKRIVESAKRTGRGIAVESLDGIRDRIRARGGDARNRLSGWAFHQLRSFVEYKALAAGVPVVATSVGGVPEVVEDGVSGFLCPSGDADALADRLDAALALDDDLVEMGLAGRDRVVQDYSFDAQATRYLDLFDDLLGTGMPTQPMEKPATEKPATEKTVA